MPGFCFEQTVRTARYCAVNAGARRNVTPKNSQRHAEETARCDIPVMHTALQIYDGVC